LHRAGIIYPQFIILALQVWLLSACTPAADPHAQAAAYANQWFAQASSIAQQEPAETAAHQGNTHDHLCHAMGLLKHPQFSCSELLQHAARINPQSRQLSSNQTRKCVGSVCGEFYELTYRSSNHQGVEGEEIMLLKKDKGAFRVYWYRSASLMAMLTAADDKQQPGNGKSADQVAYDQLTEQYPGLYQYPPCYQVRVSSSNLRGQLTAPMDVDPGIIEQQAAACGAAFCLAFVGTKVASVCPH